MSKYVIDFEPGDFDNWLASIKQKTTNIDESAEMPDAWLEFVSKLKANDEEE